MVFLTIEGGKLIANSPRLGTREIRSIDELRSFVVGSGELDVFASSSLDFPTEYTSDPATLALIGEIR